jgi:hypothetical protein
MSNIPNLHDAELYALRHDSNVGTVQCVFRTGEGQDAVLLLSGVAKFRCTDFGLQNVVLELVSTAWQEVDPEDLRSYVGWLSATTDGEQLAKPEEIALTVQDVLEGRSHCVFLIPSWGSQLGAIAARVEWQ